LESVFAPIADLGGANGSVFTIYRYGVLRAGRDLWLG
jgi:hypothetical protein